MSTRVVAATDGSAINNPHGPAGWAWFVSEQCWAAGGFPKASNQVAELFAVLALLRALPREQAVLVRTDSQFAINCLTKWMSGWKAKGWVKADGQPPANLALLKELDGALAGRDVRFEWVRGHNGDRMNEIADRLCGAASSAMRTRTAVATGPGWTGLGVSQRTDEPGTGSSVRAASGQRAESARQPVRQARAAARATSGAAPARPAAGRSARSARSAPRNAPRASGAREFLVTGMENDDEGPVRSVVRPAQVRQVHYCPACSGPIDPVTHECHCSR